MVKNNRALSARPMTVPTAIPSWLTVSMSKNSSEHPCKEAPYRRPVCHDNRVTEVESIVITGV